MDRRQVILPGKGIHGGRAERLVIKLSTRLPACPRVFLGGNPYPIEPGQWKEFSRTARNATCLEYAGPDPRYAGLRVDTLEHLLAVLLVFPDAPIDIFCEGREPPFLDGSALPILTAVKTLLGDKTSYALGWKQYACPLQWEHTWRAGGIRVMPAPEFRVSYGVVRGDVYQRAVLESPHEFLEYAVPARSFLFYEDGKIAKSRSDSPLLKGARWDSGLLLAESREQFEEARSRGVPPAEIAGTYPLLNATFWRSESELAWHKILDLLGDLALFNLALPRVHIEVENGGHFQNHQLLDRLQDQMESMNRP